MTHEYSKLAEQYAQEQQQLSGQVARLAEQVRHLADQQSADQQGYIKWSKTLGEQVEHLGTQVQRLAEQTASDQQGYVKWSKYMDEQQGILNAHVEKVIKAYNELARLLDAGLKAVRAVVEHKRTGLPDRVQGLIDNLIARSLDRGGPSPVKRERGRGPDFDFGPSRQGLPS